MCLSLQTGALDLLCANCTLLSPAAAGSLEKGLRKPLPLLQEPKSLRLHKNLLISQELPYLKPGPLLLPLATEFQLWSLKGKAEVEEGLP